MNREEIGKEIQEHYKKIDELYVQLNKTLQTADNTPIDKGLVVHFTNGLEIKTLKVERIHRGVITLSNSEIRKGEELYSQKIHAINKLIEMVTKSTIYYEDLLNSSKEKLAELNKLLDEEKKL